MLIIIDYYGNKIQIIYWRIEMSFSVGNIEFWKRWKMNIGSYQGFLEIHLRDIKIFLKQAKLFGKMS